MFDFATGVETPLRSANAPDASEFWPTIWRGTVAFARTYDSKPGYPYIYARPVAAGMPSTRLPGGSRGPKPNATRSAPSELELTGRRLSLVWRSPGDIGDQTEIRLDTLGGDHERVAQEHGGGGLTQVEVSWPAFDGGWLYWTLQCSGDPSGCPGRHGLRRYRIATGATERAPGPQLPLSHDRAHGTTWILQELQRGEACAGTPPVAAGVCALRGSAPTFAP